MSVFNLQNISFKKGSTIIAHDSLISFLHENEFRIFHRVYNDFEFDLYKNISKRPGPIQSKNEMLEDRIFSIFNSITQAGFIEHLKEENLTSNQYEILKFEHPQILHMLVMITNKCNMGCKYCYTEANNHLKKERELTGEEWIRLFETVKIPSKYRTQNISFTGGEPTIHPNFVDILKSVSGKYKVEISSNGLDINNNLIEALESLEGLNFLNISMDSYKPSEDEFMRGTGTYTKRLENIRYLYKKGIPLCFGVVVNNITVNSLEETTKYFLEEFPGTSVKYIPLTKMGLALDLEDSIFLSKNDADKYLSTLLQMKEKYQEQILTDYSSFYNKEKDLHWSGRCSHMKCESERDLYLDSVPKQKIITKSEKCNATYGTVAISPSGRMRPCLRADSFYLNMLKTVNKDILMPRIVGLKIKDIGNLPFWEIIKKKAINFDPYKKCALESTLTGG